MDLTGYGLRLRPITIADVPAVLAAADDDVQRRWHALPTTHGAAILWCAKHATGATYAITVQGDRMLGYLSLYDHSERHANVSVGYWVAAAARGRGIASRALMLARDHVFDELGLARLQLWHAVDNVGSCRVATRAGLAFEGVHRSSYRYDDGQLHDEHSHALLATDDRDNG